MEEVVSWRPEEDEGDGAIDEGVGELGIEEGVGDAPEVELLKK